MSPSSLGGHGTISEPAGRPSGPLWIVWSFYGAGSAYWNRVAMPLGAKHVSFSPAYLVASNVGGAILSGVATRILLGGGKRWWSVDGALARFVLLDTVGSLLIQTPYAIPGVRAADPGAVASGAFLGVVLLQLVAACFLIWVVVRLLLWPISQFAEGGPLTAQRAWRLMRGGFWPYLGASIVAGLLPGIVTLVLVSRYRTTDALWALIAQAPFNGLLGLILTAVTVEVYLARVVKPDTLADVFD